MRKYRKIYKMKQALKHMVEKHMEMKRLSECADGTALSLLQGQMAKQAKEIRLFGIAYGLLRGKTYEQIEIKVRTNNALTGYDWAMIGALQDKYRETTITVDAQPRSSAIREAFHTVYGANVPVQEIVSTK